MQAAGGIDWMVAVAARIIEKPPKQITLIAPLTAFLFCIGAGTSNIIYPLLPVIYDVSYKNGIRPSRPLTVTVVQSGMALAASPVSAAMAAMLTLTDGRAVQPGPHRDPRHHDPRVCDRDRGHVARGEPDVEGARRGSRGPGQDRLGELAAREPTAVAAPAGGGDGNRRGCDGTGTRTRLGRVAAHVHEEGRNSALAFFAGVVVIVLLGLFPDLRPAFKVDGEGSVPIDMTTTIVLVMFVGRCGHPVRRQGRRSGSCRSSRCSRPA